MAPIVVAVHAGGASVTLEDDASKLSIDCRIIAQHNDSAPCPGRLDAGHTPVHTWVNPAINDLLLHVD